MISFADFVPQVTASGGFFKSKEMEQLTEPLQRANEWITQNNIDVVNIETVVLPNIHTPHEEGSTDTSLRVSGEWIATWNQFIRVWYRY